MRIYRTELGRLKLVLQSLWHWDLWVAIPFGIGVGLLWFLRGSDPKWEWFVPVITLSATFFGIVWYQWNSLRSRLEDSPYGELVRIADNLETEVRIPYLITIWLAMVSVVWSTVTTIVIEDISSILVEAILLALTSMLGMWLVLSVTSLVMLSMEHDKNMAEVASIREQISAAQRHYALDSDRPNERDTEEAD